MLSIYTGTTNLFTPFKGKFVLTEELITIII